MYKHNPIIKKIYVVSLLKTILAPLPCFNKKRKKDWNNNIFLDLSSIIWVSNIYLGPAEEANNCIKMMK
jgi:hypothetical protein